jgi:hypothetical protein
MKSHRMSVAGVIPALLLGAALAQAQAPPSASTLLDQAKSQAAATHRSIFAVFHASW